MALTERKLPTEFHYLMPNKSLTYFLGFLKFTLLLDKSSQTVLHYAMSLEV